MRARNEGNPLGIPFDFVTSGCLDWNEMSLRGRKNKNSAEQMDTGALRAYIYRHRHIADQVTVHFVTVLKPLNCHG